MNLEGLIACLITSIVFMLFMVFIAYLTDGDFRLLFNYYIKIIPKKVYKKYNSIRLGVTPYKIKNYSLKEKEYVLKKMLQFDNDKQYDVGDYTYKYISVSNNESSDKVYGIFMFIKNSDVIIKRNVSPCFFESELVYEYRCKKSYIKNETLKEKCKTLNQDIEEIKKLKLDLGI